jgi:hypothetical protein
VVARRYADPVISGPTNFDAPSPRLARLRSALRARWTSIIVPVAAFVALLAWVFASPIGAGPDDDYHLVSTWCAGPVTSEACIEGPRGGDYHLVPQALADIACFAGHSEVSAGCQQDAIDWNVDVVVESDRGNFSMAYPPVYYAVNGLFAGSDVQISALLMRVFTVMLFLGILVVLHRLLPGHLRPALVWGWLVSTVPLGLFLIGSNNPSAWAMIGVGASWIALLGYFETSGRRRIGLGIVFALSVILAAGSRGDAALYAGLGIVLVFGYAFRARREFFRAAILPAVMGLIALGFFLTSRQSGSGVSGFSSPGASGGVPPEVIVPELTGFAQLFYNVLNAPFIWVGSFGEWGLGWLDTSMPAVVPLAVTAAFVGAAFAGVRRMTGRKAVIVVLVFGMLWALPVYVLQQSGNVVLEAVQPRYLLPLVVMLAGMVLLAPPGRTLGMTASQRYLIATALTGAHLIALHMNIRRYVTGVDGAGFNLDAGAEWWWTLPASPMAVWVIGSIAYGVVAFMVARPGGVADIVPSERGRAERESATRTAP